MLQEAPEASGASFETRSCRALLTMRPESVGNGPHWKETIMTTFTKPDFLAGSAVLAGAVIAMPSVLRAQATVLRWGEMLRTTHPQVQMVDRIAKQVKEKSGGRI